MLATEIIDRGTGPTVIFSHGTLLDSSMFLPQILDLQTEYRTIAYTSRAGTHRYATDYSIKDLVDDCISVADDAGVENFVLAGMSVGGFMAIDAILAHHDRIAGLILIDTMADAYTDKEKQEFGELFETMDADEPIPDWFIQTFVPIIFSQNAIDSKPDLIDKWTDKWRSRPSRSVFREFRSWIDKDDMINSVRRISVPTLILHGVDDAGIKIECAERLQSAIPSASLVRIPGAGHLVTEEAPEATTAAIRDFLKGLDEW